MKQRGTFLITASEESMLGSLMPETAALLSTVLSNSPDATSRLTVALVGQMRTGKSTIINSLVGKDIAPTAVNECTATINRFGYSSDEQLHSEFVIRWRDRTRPETRLPMEKIVEWVGKSEQTGDVEFLDLFSDSNLLKTANIVDTPGTRSTMAGHEETIRSFISKEVLDCEAERLSDVTLKHGAAADAVVYVIGPNARENDREILELFGESTRLPGSNPYNSVVVIHKWEPEWQDMSVDPQDFLKDKIERLSGELDGKVSCVMAASGLLGRCCDWLEDDQWAFFVRFGSLEEKMVSYLTDWDDYTEDDGGKYPIPHGERVAILGQIVDHLAKIKARDDAESTAWAIIRFLCRLACVRKVASVEEIKKHARELAGIERLAEVLDRRFFERSRLIKLGTVLSRLWGPSRSTLERLRIQERERREDVNRGLRVLEMLKNKNVDGSLRLAVEYVRDTFEAVRNDAKRLAEERMQIAGITSRLERKFRAFERDMEALELLDNLASSSMSFEEIKELRALFGVSGMDAEERLGCPASEEHIYERYRYWATRRHGSWGVEQKICEAAEERFQAILNQIDEK